MASFIHEILDSFTNTVFELGTGLDMEDSKVNKIQSLTSRYSRGQRLLKSHLVVTRKSLDLLQ